MDDDTSAGEIVRGVRLDADGSDDTLSPRLTTTAKKPSS
jgi:hypothetical protein